VKFRVVMCKGGLVTDPFCIRGSIICLQKNAQDARFEIIAAMLLEDSCL